jgi:adenosylcobinamide kinase / adenosylcobinamide-phosphate guanylyltransferase
VPLADSLVGWEGVAVHDPEPGDLLVRGLSTFLGRRTESVLIVPNTAPVPPLDVHALPHLTLVLGGARSGKSRHAEALIEGAASDAVYLATAEARDGEMTERIRRHRLRRAGRSSVRWQTIEEPLCLAARLAETARPGRPVLVDCLTLWLSNLLLAGRDIAAETDALLAAIPALGGTLVLVANEVGLGIVPDTALGRDFRDHAGTLNQAVAALADRVVFVVAGLPLILKEPRR